MRKLTKDIVIKKIVSGKYDRFLATCKQLDMSSENAKIFVAIYAIESFYRPVPLRIAEYIAVLVSGTMSMVSQHTVKNYTIGVCQLGLATICNYYGGGYYQHAPSLKLNGIQSLGKLLSVVSLKNSIKVLEYRVEPILQRAKNIYPHSKENQIYYVGEQFNGRYSYGLMLYEVYETLFDERCYYENLCLNLPGSRGVF